MALVLLVDFHLEWIGLSPFVFRLRVILLLYSCFKWTEILIHSYLYPPYLQINSYRKNGGIPIKDLR